MNYIIFDLEFNRDLSSLLSTGKSPSQYPYEIIQIGAIKFDIDLNAVATFNRYVKPAIYSQISALVTDLTGITSAGLLSEEEFPDIFNEFIEFIGGDNAVFCTWGMSDMKELFKNVEYHKLDKKRLPVMYINLQPYVTTYLHLHQKKLLNLKAAVEALNILMPYDFHNALYDAFYTAELFKIINNTLIQPKRYDPDYVKICPRQPKKTTDFEKLILQFEKMYSRELSNEEQGMIMLAYKMGRTNQFLQ